MILYFHFEGELMESTMTELFQLAGLVFLLILPICYELSNTFKYNVKFLLYYSIIMLTAVVSIPISLLSPKNVENHRFVAGTMRRAKRLFGIEISIRGREHVDDPEPCIMLCNHQSSLDMFGMMEVWPSRCVSLAKKELLYAGPFGLASWLCGTIFIDRLNTDKAKGTLSETARKIREDKIKVYIYPEGTRNHDGSMLPFKKGAFYLAIEAQVPIVPVVFSTYSDFYNKKEKRFNAGKFIITCLPKISTKGLTAADVPELTEKVRALMLEVYNQSSIEVSQAKVTNHS